MIRLHGGYLTSSGSGPSGYYLWAEGPFVPREERREHPRALSASALEACLSGPARGAVPAPVLARCRPIRIAVVVPALKDRPLPTANTLRDDEDYAPLERASLREFELDALLLPSAKVLETMLHISDVLPAGNVTVALAEDFEYWVETARWAWDLLLRRQVVPILEGGRARWHPILSVHFETERLHAFAQAFPPVCRTVSPAPGHRRSRVGDETYPTAQSILAAFLDEVVDASARELIRELLPPERRRAGPGIESRFVEELALPVEDLSSPRGAAWPAPFIDALSSWSLPLLAPASTEHLRLGIRLVPPPAPSPDPVAASWSLRYHLQAVDDPTLQLDAAEIWSSVESSLKRLGRRFRNPEETLLSELGAAAALSAAVARSLEEPHPEGLELTPAEAVAFMKEEAPALGNAGVELYLPGEGRPARVSLKLRARPSTWRAGSAVTRFGLSTLIDFDWQIAIGNALLSVEEFEELAARKVPFVELRGQWTLLDEETVSRVLSFLEEHAPGHTSLGEFLRLAGGVGLAPEEAQLIDEVEGESWLGEFLSQSAMREAIAAFTPPSGFMGTLRPYQARGVAWLRFLLGRGLGGCLADDMGLGKTVQFLATLLSAREAGESIRPSLLICPTSVAENWVREAARFAPSLTVAVHHGNRRAAGETFAELTRKTDLIVTTFPLAHRDRALLSRVEWEYLALDEAQNIKNPSTAQAKAIRGFAAKRRAALTGTPMENRLSELKALFDFLNSGLLGSEEVFRKEFAIPIERHRLPEAAERLRRVTAPFLLRRVKTDPAIEPDLPEKIETKEFVGLTREQATLYRATTRSLLESIGQARGAQRRARVLVLLLRLKQICNHPVLFLADGSRVEGRSAKLERLLEMLEETAAEKRPALLFTQFAEMGRILVKTLKERFATEVLFLHGGVSRTARHEMVRRFQEDDDPPPFFVLSLKAGGSGLNLTRASHVFHVDRWWNPAVEDQATDRVFRIGQTHHVQVHKFICRGTLEERIDAMIDEKKDLTRAIVGTGEAWLTELSDRELMELVTLRKEALVSLENSR
ncbi:MAG: DEAD/DEAH box helicase [Thermoanaerobaculia bacterium]|nr:DEAD/DEAH box helicase [Thermoanaerobaculia bacterium]